MATLELRHVSYRYDRPHGEQVLKDISLQIKDGEFLCIVGRSGCGKTTLLRLLAGLDFPCEGTVSIDEKPVTGPGTDRAMVFQNYTLFPWMTVRRNVEFGIKCAFPAQSRNELRQSADIYLDKVGMLRDAHKYPYQLSGGMRQRVAIARSLAMHTNILLMDEPFGALDTQIRKELQMLTESLIQQQKTIIFVTHDIREAVFLADRVIYMTPGSIACEVEIPLPRPRIGLDSQGKQQLKELAGNLTSLFQREEWGVEE